ncbi:hypothetical protein QWY16_03480 [Planococcus shenhongbingii]|uniref:hypothetical protein n=1 Tax=Planococcus shenhongbingii TaxID=3058398 RepID=UPI002636C93F|nr:hypothetical protein [Planococcus sp. N016]WKA59228.1 hypothetical protein QWY16_03480 [Planococcus sp. N016]
MSGDLFMLLPIISIFFYLVMIAVIIYVVFTFLKLGKERNAYLKQIAEELRRQ